MRRFPTTWHQAQLCTFSQFAIYVRRNHELNAHYNQCQIDRYVTMSTTSLPINSIYTFTHFFSKHLLKYPNASSPLPGLIFYTFSSLTFTEISTSTFGGADHLHGFTGQCTVCSGCLRSHRTGITFFLLTLAPTSLTRMPNAIEP